MIDSDDAASDNQPLSLKTQPRNDDIGTAPVIVFWQIIFIQHLDGLLQTMELAPDLEIGFHDWLFYPARYEKKSVNTMSKSLLIAI